MLDHLSVSDLDRAATFCDAVLAALTSEGTDNGPPGLRPRCGPGCYAAFVHDPDGYFIEAVFHDRAAG